MHGTWAPLVSSQREPHESNCLTESANSAIDRAGSCGQTDSVRNVWQECTNVNHPFKPSPSVRFNGWYWDVSHAMSPDKPAKVGLTMPGAKVGALVGLFFENTLPVATGQVDIGP